LVATLVQARDFSSILKIERGHQVGKIGVKNVSAVEFLGGWSLKGIGRGFIDKGG
jgi:hypothetical protein